MTRGYVLQHTLAALYCILSSSAAAAPPPRRTLAELMRAAGERSKQVQVAGADLDVLRAMKQEARALWAPFGEITYAITGAPAIQCRGPGNDANPLTRTRDCVNTVDPRTGGTVSSFSSGLAGVAMEGQLNVIQPIFTFGKIENAITAAGHGVAAGRAQLEAARRDSSSLAARAYWDVKAARAAMALIDAVLEELSPWIDKVAKDLDAPKPRYSINDLSRLKAGRSELNLGRAQLERGARVALRGIQLLVGEEVDVDEAQLDPVAFEELPLAHYEESAVARRPEARALGEAVAAARALARVRRSELLPDLGVTAQLLARYASSIEDADSVFVQHATTSRFLLLLGLRQPLDLVQRFTHMRRAQAEADALSARRVLAMAGIDFEVADAFAAVAQAKAELAEADQGQKVARGWLTAIQQNLDLGIGDTRDLADAAREYVLLRLRFYQAIHDFNVAAVGLRRAAGLPLAD